MMPDVDNRTSEGSPIISVVLLIFGWIANAAAEATAIDVYTWIFRAASLASVSIIIIINWRKAIEELKIIIKGK